LSAVVESGEPRSEPVPISSAPPRTSWQNAIACRAIPLYLLYGLSRDPSESLGRSRHLVSRILVVFSDARRPVGLTGAAAAPARCITHSEARGCAV
jgi:hypothetical protein